jgi:hypothetical protein
MMSVLIALSLLLAAAEPTPATSDESASSNSAQTENSGKSEAKKEKPKKICRSNSQDTGSRIVKRVCKTQEEWDAKEDPETTIVRRSN